MTMLRVEMTLGHGDFVHIKAPYALKDVCKGLPMRRWNGERKTWDIPLGELDQAVRVFSNVVSCNVVLDTKLAARYQDAKTRAAQAVALKTQREAQGLHYDLMKFPKPLYPYQPLAGQFLTVTENGVLAMDMGTGKTVSSLVAATHLFIETSESPQPLSGCIVVAPKTLLHNWRRQIQYWTQFDAIVVDGAPKVRRKLYEQFREGDIPFLILNYELCRFDYEVLMDELYETIRNSVVIADEAHRLKTARALTTMRFKGYHGKAKEDRVVGVFQDARYRWALTGTPLENRVDELWSIMDWVRPGMLGSYWQFLDKYTVRDAFGGVMAVINVDVLRNAIAPALFRKTKAEALPDLPPIVEETRQVEMTETQKKLYRQIEEGILTYVDDSGKEARSYLEVLAQLTRMQQCCDSPLLLPNCELPTPESGKLDEVMKLLDDFTVVPSDDADMRFSRLKSKVLIFSQYRKMCDILMSSLRTYSPLYIHGDVPNSHTKTQLQQMRAHLVRQGMAPAEAANVQIDWRTAEALSIPLVRLEVSAKFNEDPDTNLIVVDTAAKEGLDIYYEYGIMFDELYNPQAMSQIHGRAQRLGMTVNKVFIIHLLTPNTYEERKQFLLEQKRELFASVIDGKVDDGELVKLLGKEDLLYLLGRT